MFFAKFQQRVEALDTEPEDFMPSTNFLADYKPQLSLKLCRPPSFYLILSLRIPFYMLAV